jgi:hypothetical protein
MSIFGKISEAIFGRPATPQAPAQPVGAESGGAIAGTVTNWWTQAATQAAAQAGAGVDQTNVEASLEARAAARGGGLNWRTSIVDLMKLLDIDSSFQNRVELARELGFTGDTNDSASMNIWLHRQVMRELAANGGQVPAALTD